jgi:hypothetical protein
VLAEGDGAGVADGAVDLDRAGRRWLLFSRPESPRQRVAPPWAVESPIAHDAGNRLDSDYLGLLIYVGLKVLSGLPSRYSTV